MTRRLSLAIALSASFACRVLAQPADASVLLDAGVSPVDAGAPSRDAGANVPDGGSVDAAEPPEPELPPAHVPRVTMRLEPGASVAVGSVVSVHLVVSSLIGDDVTIPSQSFAPLELHARHVTERTVSGRTETHFVLVLLALEPGDAELEPISIRVLTEDGIVGTVSTDRIAIRVTSHIANEPNAQPKGRTRPRMLMEEDKRLFYLLAGVATLLTGGALALLLRRWLARRPKPVVPPPPPRPAWEIAFERLEALRQDGPAMIAEGRVGPWIDSLSDTVREYLGQRYGFDGLECTSDEVIARVASLRIQSASSSEIQIFLGECDLVKFAQASMTEEQAETMFRQAQRIVRSTIPGGASFGQVGGSA